jgi:hypothetical protein
VLWTVAIVITLVGAAYFLVVQRNKPIHVMAPEDESLAVEAPAATTPT